ncbi:MAG: hypothetical protein ABIQ16_16890 [Polyangiaceae bacterium]
MSARPSARLWLTAGCIALANACQDHALNLLPDSLQAGAPGGGAGLAVGAGSSGLPSSGGSDGGTPTSGGSNSNAGSAGSSVGGVVSGGGSSSDGGALGGGFDSAGAAQGGSSSDGAGNGGVAGVAGRSGAGGAIACLTDTDCAPPTPGCSPLAHVCTHCSKNSQCPTGITCSIDDGECGN